MRYHAINNNLFIQNRRNFTKKMKPGAIAIFTSNDLMTKSGDMHYKWHQSPDLFYLTGIDQEHTMLVLFPDAPMKAWKEMLFVRRTDETLKVWEGEKLSREKAAQVSGISEVRWADTFEQALPAMMYQAEHVYLNTNENDRSGDTTESAEFKLAKKIMQRFPLHQYVRSAPILTELRMIKSAEEIALIRNAIAITEKGFRRLLKFVKPGVWEFEVEAELTHEYIRNRGTGHAYEPIVASGANACILHYIENNAPCQAGDLMLLDCAAEYANYASDLTRTIPVSGKFSSRQKKVYNAVLRVMQTARSMMKEGMVLADYNTAVGEIMQEELLGLRLITKTDIRKQHPQMPAYKKYFPHGTAHFLGLDVHDAGNRYAKLKAGAVLTCEPGIYIPEEKMGIRLENNILITKGKPVDLMASIPVEADEIETLMNAK
ncbi:MAG: aminopeptidase P N-terminal domain-containing protein [Chitinophagales bacterium]